MLPDRQCQAIHEPSNCLTVPVQVINHVGPAECFFKDPSVASSCNDTKSLSQEPGESAAGAAYDQAEAFGAAVSTPFMPLAGEQPADTTPPMYAGAADPSYSVSVAQTAAELPVVEPAVEVPLAQAAAVGADAGPDALNNMAAVQPATTLAVDVPTAGGAAPGGLRRLQGPRGE